MTDVTGQRVCVHIAPAVSPFPALPLTLVVTRLFSEQAPFLIVLIAKDKWSRP